MIVLKEDMYRIIILGKDSIHWNIRMPIIILPESIEISIAFEDDAVVLHCSFRFAEEDERRDLDVIIGAVSVEVVSE